MHVRRKNNYVHYSKFTDFTGYDSIAPKIFLNILSIENHHFYLRRAMDHSVLAIYTIPVLLLYIDTTYAIGKFSFSLKCI